MPPRSLDYPDAEAQNRAELRGYYQRAVAYLHLGNLKDAKTWTLFAYSFPEASKWVSKSLWAQICALNAATGARQVEAELAPYMPDTHANALWAQQQGMSPGEIELVKYRGKPCHIGNR